MKKKKIAIIIACIVVLFIGIVIVDYIYHENSVCSCCNSNNTCTSCKCPGLIFKK